MAKKKKKKAKKVGQIKATSVGLEGVVDWVDLISNAKVKEGEEDVSSLTAGFAEQMRKEAASAQRETASGSKGPDYKRSKWSGPNEEVQKSSSVIIVDSLERAPDALPALESAA